LASRHFSKVWDYDYFGFPFERNKLRPATARKHTNCFESTEPYNTVQADERRISQVIYNLLDNTLTYTGTSKKISVIQTISSQNIRISIQDDGHGIPADELSLIWNRYYRAKENHWHAVRRCC